MMKIIDFCEKHNMLPHSGTVLAAVSGGKDSMYLLNALLELAPDYGFSVSCAHFDHRLRGAESERDSRFVAAYCAERGVPCFTGSGDVAAYANENGLGIEEAAREMRYEFLEQTADKIGASRIATAHTADDNIETLLLNLTRGAGLKGLCGIPPVRGRIIRPMLEISTVEIKDYLDRRKIPYVEDSTNETDHYARNRIRHHLVPALRSISPSLDENVLRCITFLREDEAFISSLAADFAAANFKNNRLPAEALAALPASVAARVLQQICGGGLSAAHIAAVLALAEGGAPHAAADVPHLRIRREYGDLVFGAMDAKALPETVLEAGRTVTFEDAGVALSAMEIPRCMEINNSDNIFFFQRDSICGRIFVRARKEGDAVRLEGRNCTKTLKKLFSEKKLNGGDKLLIPVICDDAGIIAVSGFGIAEKNAAKPGDDVICIKIENI